jgi:hypothetical protein
MIAHNFNPLCKEAELYYYDFLTNEGQKLIPEFIIDHITSCRYCCEQINQLKDMLLQVEDYPDLEQKQINLAAITWLKLHFAYIGRPVNCETVKPFLPGFLEPALEIKIPTPITVHLDNCQQCQEDLEAIRKLNLNSKQLYRLSRLFTEKSGEDNVSCPRAQAAILTVVSMIFGRTTEEVLKHLCVCSDCRKVLYQCREKIRNESLSSQSERKDVPCEEVSASDIFDYTIPYGLDPANDQYAKFRQSLTSHICSCPTCLAKMQQLHNIVFGILERVESEITTIYHIDESAKTKTKAIKSDDIYAGFPIMVEVAGQEDELRVEQSISAINFGTVLKQKILSRNIKPLFRIGVAAAAVILIATALFLNISTTKAVTLEGIYKAIGRVKNVYISSFIPDKKEPVQEQWVSRTLNVNLIKTGNGSILWDIANKAKKIRRPKEGSVETTTLTAEVITEIQNTITGSLGLMPFHSISEIPKDAKWKSIDDKSLEITNKTEVYELTWVEKIYEGHLIFKKWKVFTDRETNLPQRVEFYQKSIADSEYDLKSVALVEYLDDSEMQKVIGKISF